MFNGHDIFQASYFQIPIMHQDLDDNGYMNWYKYSKIY